MCGTWCLRAQCLKLLTNVSFASRVSWVSYSMSDKGLSSTSFWYETETLISLDEQGCWMGGELEWREQESVLLFSNSFSLLGRTVSSWHYEISCLEWMLPAYLYEWEPFLS